MLRSYSESKTGKPDRRARTRWSMLLLRSLLQMAPPIFARQQDSQVSSSHQGQPARNWRVWPNSPAGVSDFDLKKIPNYARSVLSARLASFSLAAPDEMTKLASHL